MGLRSHHACVPVVAVVLVNRSLTANQGGPALATIEVEVGTTTMAEVVADEAQGQGQEGVLASGEMVVARVGRRRRSTVMYVHVSGGGVCACGSPAPPYASIHSQAMEGAVDRELILTIESEILDATPNVKRGPAACPHASLPQLTPTTCVCVCSDQVG